jgi:hypothetical protein
MAVKEIGCEGVDSAGSQYIPMMKFVATVMSLQVP